MQGLVANKCLWSKQGKKRPVEVEFDGEIESLGEVVEDGDEQERTDWEVSALVDGDGTKMGKISLKERSWYASAKNDGVVEHIFEVDPYSVEVMVERSVMVTFPTRQLIARNSRKKRYQGYARLTA